jgi:hypothetical protein
MKLLLMQSSPAFCHFLLHPDILLWYGFTTGKLLSLVHFLIHINIRDVKANIVSLGSTSTDLFTTAIKFAAKQNLKHSHFT